MVKISFYTWLYHNKLTWEMFMYLVRNKPSIIGKLDFNLERTMQNISWLGVVSKLIKYPYIVPFITTPFVCCFCSRNLLKTCRESWLIVD